MNILFESISAVLQQFFFFPVPAHGASQLFICSISIKLPFPMFKSLWHLQADSSATGNKVYIVIVEKTSD